MLDSSRTEGKHVGVTFQSARRSLRNVGVQDFLSAFRQNGACQRPVFEVNVKSIGVAVVFHSSTSSRQSMICYVSDGGRGAHRGNWRSAKRQPAAYAGRTAPLQHYIAGGACHEVMSI